MSAPDDLPPVPDVRFISPASEDYATRPGLPAYVWPLFFFGVLVVLTALVAATGWHDLSAH